MDARFTIFLVSSIFLVCGCNSGGDAESNSATPDSTATNNENRLTGTWYGHAQLDMDRVGTYLGTITEPSEREQRAAIVQGFLSTEMAARFDESGNMELDMLMQPAGQPMLRDTTRGTWTVVESTPDAMVIETIEQLPSGGNETNRVTYQFGPDGNTISMTPPTAPWLIGCKPLFVFERIEESTARNPSAAAPVLK